MCRLIVDGQAVWGTTVAADGLFSLSTDANLTRPVSDAQSLILKVSMVGYNPTDIIIAPGKKNVDLGAVYLSESAALGEVTVEAAAISEVRGRTVLIPSRADVNASSSALSLFQKLFLPGLEANPVNRSLSVDGGSPVILINGIPSTIDDFNAIQPKEIARVEYSRFTPARYADSGKSGLLNITLKKRSDGGRVYLWGRSALNTAFVDANVNLSYHQGKSQFSALYTPSWRNYQSVYDYTSESFIGDDFRVDLNSRDRNPFNYFYQSARLKYDYVHDPSTLFSATFRITPLTSGRRVIGSFADSQLGQYDLRSHSSSSDFAPSLDLFFRRDFSSRHALELQVVGTLSSNDYSRGNTYIYPASPEDTYVMDVESRRRSLISEASYTFKASQATSLSAGFQNTVSHSRNTYKTTGYRPVLTENNNYIYARLGQQIGNIYLALASGAKLFWIKNDLNRRHFIRNISSAQVSWKISGAWSLQGSFRYSPDILSLIHI